MRCAVLHLAFSPDETSLGFMGLDRKLIPNLAKGQQGVPSLHPPGQGHVPGQQTPGITQRWHTISDRVPGVPLVHPTSCGVDVIPLQHSMRVSWEASLRGCVETAALIPLQRFPSPIFHHPGGSAGCLCARG